MLFMPLPPRKGGEAASVSYYQKARLGFLILLDSLIVAGHYGTQNKLCLWVDFFPGVW